MSNGSVTDVPLPPSTMFCALRVGLVLRGDFLGDIVFALPRVWLHVFVFIISCRDVNAMQTSCNWCLNSLSLDITYSAWSGIQRGFLKFLVDWLSLFLFDWLEMSPVLTCTVWSVSFSSFRPLSILYRTTLTTGCSSDSCSQSFLSSDDSPCTSARWLESFTKYFAPQPGMGQSRHTLL